MAPALRMTRSIKEKLPVFFIRYWAIFEVLRLLAICVVGRVSVRNRQKSPFLFFFLFDIDLRHHARIYIYPLYEVEIHKVTNKTILIHIVHINTVIYMEYLFHKFISS